MGFGWVAPSAFRSFGGSDVPKQGAHINMLTELAAQHTYFVEDTTFPLRRRTSISRAVRRLQTFFDLYWGHPIKPE